MAARRTCLTAGLALLVNLTADLHSPAHATGTHAPPTANDGTEYRSREGRYEGRKTQPVGFWEIELISALVEFASQAVGNPDTLRLGFCVPDPVAVHVTVRELDNREFYWMDRLEPQERPRGYAEFKWSTAEVIRPLGLRAADLAVVARLGKATASQEETVAPVSVYDAQVRKDAQGYLFHLLTSADARLGWTLYRDLAAGALDTVATGAPLPCLGGVPFAIPCRMCGEPAGWYRLVVDGHASGDLTELRQTARFYHHSCGPCELPAP